MSGGFSSSLGGFASAFTRCPNCGLQLAEADRVAGRNRPAADVVSICKGCAEIIVFTRNDTGLALRATTASEYLSLNEEAQGLLRVAHTLVREQLKRRAC